MQQDFVFEDEDNNEVSQGKNKKSLGLGVLDPQLWLGHVFL